MRPEDGQIGVALVGWMPGQRGEEHAAERVDVRSMVDGAAFDGLRREIADRADDLARSRQGVARAEPLGQSEVTQVCVLSALTGRDQDVGGLDVPVDEAARMGGIEGVSDTRQEAHDPAWSEGPLAADEGIEVGAFDVAHGQEQLAVGLAGFEDGHDIGVVDRRGKARFGQEPGTELGVGGDLRGQQLERHLALERFLCRQPDRAHTAATEQSLESIACQDGARNDLRHGSEYACGDARRTIQRSS